MGVNNNNSRIYHSPWDSKGFWWKMLLLMLGILLIVCFFGLLLGGDNANNIADNGNNNDNYDGGNHSNDNNNDGGVNTVDDIYFDTDPYEGVRDSSAVDDWRDNIPNVPELPDPQENVIQPFDSTDVGVNPDDPSQFIIQGQLVVLFNSQDINKDMSDFAARFKRLYPGDGYEVAYYNPNAGTMLLAVPQSNLSQVMNELPQKITGIDFVVTTNEVINETSRPSDNGFAEASYDEYFRLIQAYDAWDVTKGSPDVKVAIVDSYFDLTHPEIGSRYADCINIITGTKDVLPPRRKPNSIDEIGAYCHGTHVAGIAIGGQDNGVGCSGIAPQCSWIPISVGCPTTSFAVLEGILYAIYHGADVINLSMGAAFPDDVLNAPLEEQIEYVNTSRKQGEKLWQYVYKIASDHKCVLCKAAGNDNILMGMDVGNRNGNFINVEAVDGKGIKANFSNFGVVPEVGMRLSVVAAPGVGIWSSTDPRCARFWEAVMEDYPQIGKIVSGREALEEMDGTSMATPFVSGTVALLKSKNKNLSTEDIIRILVTTALQTDTDTKHRIGPTIQIKDALDAVSANRNMTQNK